MTDAPPPRTPTPVAPTAPSPIGSSSNNNDSSSSDPESDWQVTARRVLDADAAGDDDPKRRLALYGRLCAECRRDKAQQRAVGRLLREPLASDDDEPPTARSSSAASVHAPARQRLELVFRDLAATDRTLRCAAARLLCHVAYESLVDQEAVLRHSRGLTVGWLHVFSVPEAFRASYRNECARRARPETARGLVAFIRQRVIDHYDEVYANVSRYYARGCATYLPLSWAFPRVPQEDDDHGNHVDDGTEGPQGPDTRDAVADPAQHLIGFYLVPRQAQFPEPDELFYEDLLSVVDAEGLTRLQAIKGAFDAAVDSATRAGNNKTDLNEEDVDDDGHARVPIAVLRATCRERGLTWFTEDSSSTTTPPQALTLAPMALPSLEAFTMMTTTTGSGDPATTTPWVQGLTWGQVLIFAIQRLLSLKFIRTYDLGAFAQLASAFSRLAVVAVHDNVNADADHGHGNRARHVTASAFVWAPMLFAAILDLPTSSMHFPEPFRRHMRALQTNAYPVPGRARPSSSNNDPPSSSSSPPPWTALLAVKLEHLTPVTWTGFLAQWATFVDSEAREAETLAEANDRRRSSVLSIASLRRSITTLHPRSFRHLTETRSSRQLSSHSLPVFHESAYGEDDEDEDNDEGDDDHEDDFDDARRHDRRSTRSTGPGLVPRLPLDDDDGDEDEDSLAYNLALFHRMQRSLATIDGLNQRRAEAKQLHKARQRESVAHNRKRAELDDERRREELAAKHREQADKLATREQHKERVRSVLAERQRRRHEAASQRKQHVDAELAQWQQEVAERLEERDQARQQVLHVVRAGPPSLVERQRPQPRPHTHRDDDGVSMPRRRVPAPPTAPRPHTARTTSRDDEPVSPDVLRQRAQLYGQVVSKIYVAESVRRPVTPSIQPHHMTRSFSTFRMDSFNVKAPVAKAPPAMPRPGSKRRLVASRSTLFTSDRGEQQQQQQQCQSPTDPLRGRTSPRPPEEASSTVLDGGGLRIALPPNACTTLVMRNAAIAVSERINIPEVPAPAVEDPSIPPYIIEAQYAALGEEHQQRFRQRFNLKCVSHRLSYAVLKQYTKIVRRDMAWQEFHDMAALRNGPHSTHSAIAPRIKHVDFVLVAQKLGIALSEKRLLRIARQLDPMLMGTIEWKAFYTWWSVQFDENMTRPGLPPPVSPTRSTAQDADQ